MGKNPRNFKYKIRLRMERFHSKIKYGRIQDPYLYMKNNYGAGWSLVEMKNVAGFQALDIKDFKGEQHCTITSLTAVFSYFKLKGYENIEDQDLLFESIFKIARDKNYYSPRIGTRPFFISSLARKVWKKYSYKNSFENILCLNPSKKLIELLKLDLGMEIPGLISFTSGDYKFHTVSYYGYKEFIRGEDRVFLLKINDNWSKSPVYIDLGRTGLKNKTIFMLSRPKIKVLP